MVLPRYVGMAVLGVLAGVGQLAAQGTTGTIVGRVLDGSTRQPLAGANVVVEGTQRGTLTRADGAFALPGVPAGTYRVQANLIGYAPDVREVVVAAGATVSVEFALQPQAVELEELVATGYGTTRRVALTASVTQVDATEANVGVISSANDMIQGRVPGVQITANNGEPGAGMQVRIRGGTSISASSEPLYVIDGVPIDNRPTEARGIGIDSDPPLPRNPLALLNPSDIESITILKDAAATAIYGSRAANGVILIQTRRGAPGSFGMEYDGYVAMSQAAKRLDVLTGAEYRRFVEEQAERERQEGRGETRFQERLERLGSANTDWQGALLRTARTHNHNLAFFGGNETTQYRASLNYMNQEGVVISNGFERLQGRINASHQAMDGRLRLGLNLTASRINNDYLPYENTGGFEGGVFTNMVIYDPTRPITVVDPVTQREVYYEHGPGRQEQRNPVALANQVQDFGRTTRTLGNASAELDLFGGLGVRLNVGVDRSEGLRQTYLPRSSPVGAEFQGRARQVSTENTALTLQGLLTFRRMFGDQHEIDAIGGYEVADYRLEEFGAEGRGFATDAFGFNNLGSASQTLPADLGGGRSGSWREDSRLVSFFSRVNYGFMNRYFVTGVLRYDGSSRFGEGNKWALFPAISASWRLSEESFLQGGPFTDLRLRAGFGLQGNPAVPPYSSLVTLAPGNHYSFGEQPVVGITPNRNANPNLKWEETSQFNVAVDFGLLGDRLGGTIEYYVKNTSDLLLEVPAPQPALVPRRLENVGKTRSRGVEVSLDAVAIARPGLTWRAGLVVSADRNEVVDLAGQTSLPSARASGQGQSDTWTQRLMPGHALGTFYGPVFSRVSTETAVVGSDTLWVPGQQLFKCRTSSSRCLNGETAQPTADDFQVIGDANPDFTFGLRSEVEFGRFDVSFLIRGEVGQDVFNNTAMVYATKGAVFQGRNFLRSALNDGVGLEEPAIYSSRWIEDGSFVRVQNLTIGYRPELGFLSQVRRARVYVSFDNLLLLTRYSGYDPEVHTAADGLAVRGVDYLNYPRARTATVGINLAF